MIQITDKDIEGTTGTGDCLNLPTAGEYHVNGLSKINIVMGKNGCGKSTLLRNIEDSLQTGTEYIGRTRYITPERGGALIYEAGIEQNIVGNDNWLQGQRRRNQTINFRQQSVAQYRKLELLVLREIEKPKRSDTEYTFDAYIKEINTLLDNIEIRRHHQSSFKIFEKNTENELPPDRISSGESELISLGIECLIFSKELDESKHNLLLLDEPDVHLHPDLQVRLMQFLHKLVSASSFRVVVATHSTAILGAIESLSHTRIVFLTFGQKEIFFKSISAIYKKILPVFGAHPLSNVFNQAPLLLLEGEDDERIWQQVVRSANGRISLYPCSVDGLGDMNKFETEAITVMRSVYDNARAFSLRDMDLTSDEIQSMAPMVRMRLSCRAAENLMLTNESLQSMGLSWEDLKSRIEHWLQTNREHVHFGVMEKFKLGGFDRRTFDLKVIRNDLMGVMGSCKPWEIVVGKVIAKVEWDGTTTFDQEGTILAYLGEKVVKHLLPNKCVVSA